MSAELKLLTFNTHDSFDTDGGTNALLNLIEAEQPDVISFVEASSAAPGYDPIRIEEAKLALASLYKTTSTPGYPADRRRDDHHLFVGTKHGLDANHEIVHDGIRSRIDIELLDLSTLISAMHLLERWAGRTPHFGSDYRLKQAQHLPSDPRHSKIRTGDFNNANPAASPGKFYRLLKGPANLLPAGEPGEETKSIKGKIKRIGSIAQRVTDMPNREVYQALTLNGELVDANRENIATHAVGIPIDGIIHSRDFATKEFNVLKDPEINQYIDDNGEQRDLSDHWPVTAVLEKIDN